MYIVKYISQCTECYQNPQQTYVADHKEAESNGDL